MREAPLPIEFQSLAGKVHYVRKVGGYEFSSTCPNCGGSMHEHGEYPDRFRMFTKSRATGGALGFCRQCGYIWTPKNEKLDPESQQRWIEERRAYELERKQKAEHAIELLRKEQVWVRYHENLTGEVRQYYHKRGIDDYWIDYFELGYNPEKRVWTDEGEYFTPALTIPVFYPQENEPITIRNRLLNPLNPADKYRPETSGLPSSLYFTDRDNEPENKVLVVEGEFKAMTVMITLDDPTIFVVGTPGKTPSDEIMNPLKNCEVVYLLLDPDAYVKQANERVAPITRMVNYFGDKARVIQTPAKIDDMISNGWLFKKDLKNLLDSARRVR